MLITFSVSSSTVEFQCPRLFFARNGYLCGGTRGGAGRFRDVEAGRQGWGDRGAGERGGAGKSEKEAGTGSREEDGRGGKETSENKEPYFG